MLEIFVSPECEPCDHARRIACRVRAQYPDIEVKVIDVWESPDQVPDEVFAVPSFLLDGALLSLGNPRWDDLVAALRG